MEKTRGTAADIMTTPPNILSVVALREGNRWIAQCLEYDIVAQSDSLEKLPHAFALAFFSHLAVRARLEQDPFKDVPRAPEKYWGFFVQADLQIRQRKQHLSTSEDLSPVRVPTLDVRALTSTQAA